MGEVVNFPIALDSDLGRQLIVDCCRFQEKILTEQQVRKKYRFDEAAWEALGTDEMVRAVEEESIRRIRDGSSKREKSQLLVTRAPDVLSKIMDDDSQSARHRIDSCKVLNDFCNGPGDTAPAADRFIINIVLNADNSGSEPATLHFNKRITPLAPGEVDPDDVGPDTGMIAAIAAKKRTTAVTTLFDRLAQERPRQNGEDPSPQGHAQSLNWLQHGLAGPMESDQDRQERLEARLDTLAADLRRFRR